LLQVYRSAVLEVVIFRNGNGLFMGSPSFLKSANTVFSCLLVYKNNWQMTIENAELKLCLQLGDMLTSFDFKRLLLCFI